MSPDPPPTQLPPEMQAVYLERFGGSEVLVYGPRPVPVPGPREVLIRVHGASVNPRDWLIRSGRYVFRRFLPSLPFVLGSDVAGVVETIGREVEGFRPGDEVFAMIPTVDGFGGYAQFAAVRESAVAPKPRSLSFLEAAALPLAGLTALQAVRDEGRLRTGQRALVVGAVGGVGHYGVQLAKALGAAEVVGVCSERNRSLALSLGCDRVVDYRRASFQEQLAGERFHLVFDTIGRESLASCRPVLHRRGRYVTTVPGPRAAWDSLRSRLRFWGPQARTVLVRSRGDDLRTLAELADATKLRSSIDRIEPLERARELHDYSRSFRTRGKNVLEISWDDS